ncbi:haloacid dehalogenase-like hydrolase [Granulosicoccaceae sp. 1_MG-2023]|nr:haloacid dehalogenase-like hydrolase [Granulosicoccaceae sp. 1_MG-2023]
MSGPLRLILDIDGTLLDSVAVHERAFDAALAAGGLPTVAQWGGVIEHYTDGWVFSAIYQRVHQCKPEPAQAAAFEAHFYDAFMAETADGLPQAVPGAAAFLSALRPRSDIAAAFATGSFGAVANAKLQCFGEVVRELPLISSTGFSTRESIVASALRCLPGDGPVVLVGDGQWDRRVARQSAAAFVGINFSGVPDSGVENECYFPDFSDTPAVLAALTSFGRA